MNAGRHRFFLTGSLLLLRPRPAAAQPTGQAGTRCRRCGAATAQDALGFAARHGEQWIEGWTKTILAEVASRRSDAQASEQRLVGTQQIAAQLGMRPLLAHCHLGLGRLYGRSGKRGEAHEHLTTATTLYREMDMRFWLEQVEAEMKGV